MKKLLIISALLLLTSCSKDYSEANVEDLQINKEVSIMKGTITEKNGSTATVEINSDQVHILAYGDFAKIDLGKTPEKFSVGDEIVIYYTGEIKGEGTISVDEQNVISIDEFNELNAEPEINEEELKESGEIQD